MTDFDRNINEELLRILQRLIRDWEYEVVEFKEASNNYKQDEIGRYFSAISNEASLKNLQHGWLVFGVNNKTREIASTNYRDTQGLERLKHEIAHGRAITTGVTENHSAICHWMNLTVCADKPGATGRNK